MPVRAGPSRRRTTRSCRPARPEAGRWRIGGGSLNVRRGLPQPIDIVRGSLPIHRRLPWWVMRATAGEAGGRENPMPRWRVTRVFDLGNVRRVRGQHRVGRESSRR